MDHFFLRHVCSQRQLLGGGGGGDGRQQQATAGDSRRRQATASGGWQWQLQVVVDRWCQQKEVAAGNY